MLWWQLTYHTNEFFRCLHYSLGRKVADIGMGPDRCFQVVGYGCFPKNKFAGILFLLSHELFDPLGHFSYTDNEQPGG